jgi:SAM-dependent methyltransferase
MESAVRYARYVYDSVKPWLQSPILEIGAGYGTYTRFLLQHGPVISCDIDPACLDGLRRKFEGAEHQTTFVDLNDAESIQRLAQFGARSVFTTNVFEHIEDDVRALQALRGAVAPGAVLAIVVPAHPRLFGYLDEQAGHFRRYTRTNLADRLAAAGWHVEKTFYINALGGLGWWFNHRFVRQRPLDARSVNAQLVLYDRLLVPLARLSDPLFHRRFGLSVVGIARSGNSGPAS